MATILIVDDRPINREYLVILLGSIGHRLLEAADGEEGLEIARAECPDLIITDILMPTLDGFALVRELRADLVLAPTPVIFYTAAYLEAETRKLALSCGVQHILIKPLEPHEVIHAVEAALNRSYTPPSPLAEAFTLEHLHLLTNKLYQKVSELEASNAELEKRTAELAEANARLLNLSLTDELTKLYNRRGFLELATKQLKLVQRAQHRLCLIYMDIDDMKAINDRFGHNAGDAALTHLSQILRHTFRDSDVIARIGGDEFAILVLNAADDSAEVIQARLQANLDVYNHEASHFNYVLSISMGTLWVDPAAKHTIEDLLTKADAAMYVQKQSKKQ
jgi:diguanylate cyclase (GGDEF)-like protein